MREELLGFTTKTFANPVKVGKRTLEGVLRWAAAQDFGWVEIRDARADIEDKYLRMLDGISGESGLAVQYAWDGSNILSDADGELFARGLGKAACFRKARYSRITIAGDLFKADRTKLGYSREEARLIGQRVASNVRRAESYGIMPVFENSHEPLRGDGESFYGIDELMQSAEEMRLAFDPANFLNLKAPLHAPSWDALGDFYARHSRRIPYVHLKSVGVDGLLSTFEIQNMAEATCIHRMWQEKKLLCIELPEMDDPQAAEKNILSAKKRILRLKDEIEY
jgi:hypothetical protein